MFGYENFLIVLSYILILNFLLTKLPFLKDKKEILKHKSFINQKLSPPFSGGILFLLTILIFFPNENLPSFNFLKRYFVPLSFKYNIKRLLIKLF